MNSPTTTPCVGDVVHSDRLGLCEIVRVRESGTVDVMRIEPDACLPFAEIDFPLPSCQTTAQIKVTTRRTPHGFPAP
jgi:hypothetical protein